MDYGENNIIIINDLAYCPRYNGAVEVKRICD
jgi:hypothetical protein